MIYEGPNFAFFPGDIFFLQLPDMLQDSIGIFSHRRYYDIGMDCFH
jgi:hypothetical protein